MEKVKEYLNFVDPHWIAVMATGLYTHLRQICIIGLCFENEKLPFDQSYASVLFVFSVLCLLAEYRLWPVTLKEPPIQVLYIYEMLIAALSTNLAINIIWIPMMHGIHCLTQESSRWLMWLNNSLGLDDSLLKMFAEHMEAEYASTYMALCMSLLSFVWMLDATESLENILDTWSKRLQIAKENAVIHRRHKGRRITFSDPEVTQSFFYRLCRMNPFGTNQGNVF